jgi:lipoic acid synthetase
MNQMMESKEPIIIKPEWLKKKIPSGGRNRALLKLLREYRLHTVCEEAQCPNLGECFSRGTATFMILGDICTRNCSFCAVKNGIPLPPDESEPEMVALAVKDLGLRYTVITSVSRDDLPDGGASHFASTIKAIHKLTPHVKVEVLVPDFSGSEEALTQVVEAGPDVINHNIETVPRLYGSIRPQANYTRSLWLLRKISEMNPKILRKSGIILGLGEDLDEVFYVMRDLLDAGCQILSLGQYLSPSPAHHRIVRFLHPEEFSDLEDMAYRMGFKAVASGPFVRSSFKAEELYRKCN